LENVLAPSYPVECEPPTEEEECDGPGCSQAVSLTYHANSKARYLFSETEATIHVAGAELNFLSHSTESK
jgi:hypothetical protein